MQEVFAILKDLRDKGVTILLIEQNAKQALQISDYGLVLEQGQTRIEDTAPNILADPRIAQLFLGGGLAPAAEHGMSVTQMLVGLIGANIMGSLSPALYADAFAAAGIDGLYHLMDVDRLPGRRLPHLLDAIKDGRLCRHQRHLSVQARQSSRCSTSRSGGRTDRRGQHRGDRAGRPHHRLQFRPPRLAPQLRGDVSALPARKARPSCWSAPAAPGAPSPSP